MSQRQPDRRRQTSGGSPRRGAAARAASTTRELLANIARVILLAILLGATVQAVAILVEQPASLGPQPTVKSYVSCTLAVLSAVLMLALALNASYLPDRLFPARRLGILFAVVSVTGAAAIVVGLLGSFRLGTVVAVDLLLAVVPFVLMGLVSPGLYRRPEAERRASRRAAADDEDSATRSASRERARQRRGGRARR
jgi:hypothetical protein